jgi:hypothetical protein
LGVLNAFLQQVNWFDVYGHPAYLLADDGPRFVEQLADLITLAGL